MRASSWPPLYNCMKADDRGESNERRRIFPLWLRILCNDIVLLKWLRMSEVTARKVRVNSSSLKKFEKQAVESVSSTSKLSMPRQMIFKWQADVRFFFEILKISALSPTKFVFSKRKSTQNTNHYLWFVVTSQTMFVIPKRALKYSQG